MINQTQLPKIALIGYRLSGGGSDRVMANLSLYLEQKGFEVHCVTVIDEISYPYGGELFNMGLLKNKTNGLYNKWVRLKALRNYLKENRFDCIIDFRFRTKIIQELLLARWVYQTKTIFTIHSFLIDHYMPNVSWLTRWMYGKCYANVAINDEIKRLVEQKHQLKNVVRIYNFVAVDTIQKASCEPLELHFDYVVAVGRLDDKLKQFDVLIESFSKSVLPKKNIHLVIVGEGKSQKELESMAERLQVSEYVHFAGFQSNPFNYLKNAKFTVLTSAYEGLPMVLLESLACGTPIVAFDCDSGPREIVIHKKNGLLVENQNKEALISAMNQMTEDEKLLLQCKENAVASVEKFSINNIGNQWLELLVGNTDLTLRK